MARTRALLLAAALLLAGSARDVLGSRALRQLVKTPVDSAAEFSAWLPNMTVAVHTGECNPTEGEGWDSPTCSLVLNSSAPAYPVPRAEGDQGAAWVTYLDFEHADNMTDAIVFDTFNYNITLDAPAPADNAILGVVLATVNASGAITCYGKLFMGEVESCTEFVLAELPLANGAMIVDPVAAANVSVVKGGPEVLGLQGNLSSSTAGESVVFLSEAGIGQAASNKEFDFVFLIMANSGFTINSVGFAEPGLRPQGSAASNTTIAAPDPISSNSSSPFPVTTPISIGGELPSPDPTATTPTGTTIGGELPSSGPGPMTTPTSISDNSSVPVTTPTLV